MAYVSNMNITYCVSVLVQGVQCPAKRRGEPCHMAHTMGKVNPRKCNREGGGGECRCKDRKYPFVCQFIHKGETKEMYSIRVGFDPEHTKYNNYSYKEYESEYNECGKVVDELDGKIFGKFDLSNIPEKDKAYVRRTQNSIHHLYLKRKWLYKIMKEMVGSHKVKKDDKYYRPLEEKMKNREKVRAAVAKGKHVSVERVFECEDDEEEFEHHLDECFRDATMEYLEDGGRIGDFDKHDYESYLEKEMVKSAIRSWDEQESGKIKEDDDERLRRLDEDDYLRDLDYAKSQYDTLHVDVNELVDDELVDIEDEDIDVVRKNEAADRAAVDVRKMKEEALLTGAIKSIDEAHAELVRKERYKEKLDKWYYGED